MPDKLPKDEYMVLNALEATGAPLPACEFKSVALKFIGAGDGQTTRTEWAESVLRSLEERGFVRRLAPISDKGPGYELTSEGRAAFAADPITVKKQDLSHAMAERMCQTALSQEGGRPYEAHYDRATYKALEGRGLVTVEQLPDGLQHIRLTEDGKDICEQMMDRPLTFPPEEEASADLEV
jgi:DNA-binding MarR family transcriptional regulator